MVQMTADGYCDPRSKKQWGTCCGGRRHRKQKWLYGLVLLVSSISSGLCIYALLGQVLPGGIRVSDSDVVGLHAAGPEITYSWSICSGPSGFTGAWQFRSCHYKRLCYDGNPNGTFLFFSHLHEDADLSVSAAPLGDAERNAIMWNPQIVHGEIPRNASVTWVNDIDGVQASTYYVFVEYNSENFGHILGDSLFPMWRLLDMFGLEGTSTRALRLRTEPAYFYNCDYQVTHGILKNRDACDRRMNKVMGPFLDGHRVNEVQGWFKATVGIASRPHYLCFPDVVAGIGFLADHGYDHSVHGLLDRNTLPQHKQDVHAVGLGSALWRFRGSLIRRLGLSMAVHTGIDVILIQKKMGTSGKRMDLTRLLSQIKSEWPKLVIRSDVDLGALSMRNQIQLIRRTRVLITETGGSSMISLFLPRHATSILLGSGHRKYLDMDWHGNMAHVSTIWCNVSGHEGLDHDEIVDVMRALRVAFFRLPKSSL